MRRRSPSPRRRGRRCDRGRDRCASGLARDASRLHRDPRPEVPERGERSLEEEHRTAGDRQQHLTFLDRRPGLRHAGDDAGARLQCGSNDRELVAATRSVRCRVSRSSWPAPAPPRARGSAPGAGGLLEPRLRLVTGSARWRTRSSATKRPRQRSRRSGASFGSLRSPF